MAPTNVDCIPYSTSNSSREILLQSLLEEYLDIFHDECMLPTDSEKYKLTERVKSALLPSRGGSVNVVRKSKVLELIDDLASNPPGVSGVQTAEGVYGNKYIDIGWTEVLRRLKDSVERL